MYIYASCSWSGFLRIQLPVSWLLKAICQNISTVVPLTPSSVIPRSV